MKETLNYLFEYKRLNIKEAEEALLEITSGKY
jgi:hypothetical protein